MHISEGALSPAVLAGGYALTAAGVAVGLRKTGYERLTAAAVLSATFFVGSLVHVPLGPGSAHLLLNGLLGLFLGWAVFPALLVALALQAALLGYGGPAVLGANVFILGFPTLVCAWAFRPWIARGGPWRTAGAFACGALSVAGAGGLAALALLLSRDEYGTSATLIWVGHVPIMVVEGIVTALAARFVARTRPDLLRFDRDDAAGEDA